MSPTISIALLMIGEFLLLTLALVVYLFRVNRKQSRELSGYRNQPPPSKPASENSNAPAPDNSLEDHIKQTIALTKNQLEDASDDNKKLLQLRIAFLESETNALLDNTANDDYWDNLCQRLAIVVPDSSNDNEEVAPESGDAIEELAELDDLQLSPGIEIPTLNEEVVVESQPDTDDSDQTGTSKKDIKRLRSILGKQLDAIGDLKQAVGENNQDDSSLQNLANPIEELEVSHAQFKMCINAIEKENVRLTTLIQTNNDATDTTAVAQDQTQATEKVNDNTQQRLQQAEATITDLENINETQYQEIERLQSEITALKTQLEEKRQLLEKHEADQSDLSKFDENDVALNPVVIQQEIDTINEALNTKEQALTELQSQHTDATDSPEPILDDALFPQTEPQSEPEPEATDDTQPASIQAEDPPPSEPDDKNTSLDSKPDQAAMEQSILEDFDFDEFPANVSDTSIDPAPLSEPAEASAPAAAPPEVLDSTKPDPLATDDFDYESYLNNEAGTDSAEHEPPPDAAKTISDVSPQTLLEDEVINQTDLDDFNYEDYLNDESKSEDDDASTTANVPTGKTA